MLNEENIGDDSVNRYILGIDGMSCSMCEAHVQDAINLKYNVKKAKASRTDKELVVITEQDISEEDFHKVLDPTGYKMVSYRREEAVKKLLGWS